MKLKKNQEPILNFEFSYKTKSGDGGGLIISLFRITNEYRCIETVKLWLNHGTVAELMCML